MDFEQTVRDMDAEIRVDPDQLGVKGCMMELRQRKAIRDDRLPKLLVSIDNDVSGIEQPRIRQVRDRASSAVGREHRISERCLMQRCFDFTKCIPAFGGIGWQSLSGGPRRASRNRDLAGLPSALCRDAPFM